MSVVSTIEAPVLEGGSDDAHREASDKPTSSTILEDHKPEKDGYPSPPLTESVDDLARADNPEVALVADDLTSATDKGMEEFVTVQGPPMEEYDEDDDYNDDSDDYSDDDDDKYGDEEEDGGDDDDDDDDWVLV